jgi:thiamine biosynthesis protein ThiS
VSGVSNLHVVNNTLEHIEILVNGKAASVSAGQTVLQLLAELGVQNDRVAVELDRQIVHKRNWESTAVAAGAQIEIVEFVGGG